MTVVYNILYVIAFAFALPLLWYKSWRTGKYRGTWGERFGKQKRPPTEKPATQKRLMLHCVSVGELLSVRGVVFKFEAAAEYGFKLEMSTNNVTWATRRADTSAANATSQAVVFPAFNMRYIRITFTSLPPGKSAALSSVRVH